MVLLLETDVVEGSVPRVRLLFTGDAQSAPDGSAARAWRPTQTARPLLNLASPPITNEAYNVLAALHSKLEGLEAYRKFQQSGDNQTWQQLSQMDNQAVELLVQRLEQLVRDGKFRPQQPGRAG